MNEAPDPLDAELAALRPRALSPDFHRRLGEHLARRTARRRWLWGVALAGAGVAALVIVAPWRQRPVPPGPPVVVPAPPAEIVPEDAVPALVAYRRALARSPEDLDALLDRPARSGPVADSSLMSVGPFPRSGPALDALLGDD